MDLKARQDLNQGFGNALGLAVEMVGTPMLFGLGGWALDRWIGTAPLFTLVLFLFGVIGMGLKAYYAYVEKMKREEANTPLGSGMTAAALPETPAVERAIARDLVRRGALLAPAIVIICALGFGRDGALTAAYAVAIVLANLIGSAALLAWAAPKGPTVLMGTALGGFLGRMILVGLAVWAVSDASWVHMKLLAVTVLLTHLGLLAWETRFVSASLAYPALKPRGEK